MLDYTFSGMDTNDLNEALLNQPIKLFSSIQTVLAMNNILIQLPESLQGYKNLRNLDVSFNQLTNLPECLIECYNLTSLVVKNNLLEDFSLPKNFGKLSQLKELNLSGNQFTRLPDEVFQLGDTLTTLHFGANRLQQITSDIRLLRKLEVLYLGGNHLTELPIEIGQLTYLKVFVLCENNLECLPSSVSNLKQLKSLLLHRNRLTSLPVELIKLRNLMELSLRDNPLVIRFVRDLQYNPPSLMELAARTVKTKKLQYQDADLPRPLLDYLNCAHTCVNPRCKGVYFDNCVEHIKFVDFCGKYRIPLLQYLCSPKCGDHQFAPHEISDSDSELEDDKIKKVLLG
jgi:hypothetical protein